MTRPFPRGWRWLLLSALCVVLAYHLALLGKLTMAFATVVTVALGGGHVTNMLERPYFNRSRSNAEPTDYPG